MTLVSEYVSNKYTVYGSKQLDARIDRDMDTISKSVASVIEASDLVAVILGGGYGRAEGGVFLDGDSESLFNDYDLFVIVRNISKKKIEQYQSALHDIGEGLGEKMGIDVDFGPLKTPAHLKNAPFWLVYYELKYGHRVIYGDSDVLSVMPDWDGNDIELMEGLKLLLNRAVGLILSGKKIEEGLSCPEDNEFVVRNIFKAIMAIGDVFLMMQKSYNYSYQKRLQLMEEYKENDVISRLNLYGQYCKAMNYKLQPSREIINSTELRELLTETIRKFELMYYLAFEAYYKIDLVDKRKYFKCIESSSIHWGKYDQIAKNALLNLRDCGLKNFSLQWYLRYPRYRLFYTLPFFIFGNKDLSNDDVCKALSVRPGTDIVKLEKRFLQI